MPKGNPNPKVNTGNKGGGTWRKADYQKLYDLAFGKVKLEDVQPKEKIVKRTSFDTVNLFDKKGRRTGTKRVKIVQDEVVLHFENAWASICYNALTNQAFAHKILDKLYADQRNVTFEDETLPTKDKLREVPTSELKKMLEEIRNGK